MATDYNALRLKFHGNPEALDQILQQECRAKCVKKLSETISSPLFRFPSLALAEMCTSDEVAEIHAGMVTAECTVLDMTAGLGIDSIHFAQCGCIVTAIELDTIAAEILKDNVRDLHLSDKIEVVQANSVEWLRENSRHYDVIFIDPARRDSSGRHFSFSQCMPDITSCLTLLTERCRQLIIKASPMIDIEAGLKELGHPQCDVTIIGTTKECKEVVLEIGDGCSGQINCITVGKGCYTIEHPLHQSIYRSIPHPSQWLQQPYPAVMKIGGNVDGIKLHVNTHLYIADEYQPHFPGHQYVIEEIFPFNKRTISEVSQRYPQINVAVRNFPIPAPQLAKRLRVKDGGDKMLFGVTLADENRYLIVTSMAL